MKTLWICKVRHFGGICQETKEQLSLDVVGGSFAWHDSGRSSACAVLGQSDCIQHVTCRCFALLIFACLFAGQFLSFTAFWGWQVLWQGHYTNPWIAGIIFDWTTDRRATEWAKADRNEVSTLSIVDCSWLIMIIHFAGWGPASKFAHFGQPDCEGNAPCSPGRNFHPKIGVNPKEFIWLHKSSQQINLRNDASLAIAGWYNPTLHRFVIR